MYSQKYQWGLILNIRVCANINCSFVKRELNEENLFNKIMSWKSTYYQNGKLFKIYPLTSSTYVKADLLEYEWNTILVIYTINISK